jgi:hypothetical protein
MKRLSEKQPEEQMQEIKLPDAPLPEVYKSESNVPADALPKSKVYSSIKKLSSFKKIKKDFKVQTQKEIFVADVKALLGHLDSQEHKMDTELLVEVLNACEEYFVYGDRETRELSKTEAVKELMVDFFESELVLDKFVSVLSSKVKKSTVLRRLLKRVSNFFF